MTGGEARSRARALYLDDDHPFGCAETSFIVLKEVFGLPDAGDASPVMALNGGVASAGNVCGAITGSAVAAGVLAGRLEADHASAKRLARELVAELLDGFRAEFGSVICRELIGRSIDTAESHQAFLDSGLWRTVCMRQVEFAVEALAAAAQARGLPDAVTTGGLPCSRE